MDAEVAAELTDGDVRHGRAGVHNALATGDPAGRMADDAVEVPCAAVGPRQRDGEVLPEQAFHGHVAAGRDQLHVELKRPRKRVGEPQPAEGERVAADR